MNHQRKYLKEQMREQQTNRPLIDPRATCCNSFLSNLKNRVPLPQARMTRLEGTFSRPGGSAEDYVHLGSHHQHVPLMRSKIILDFPVA
jgi:hypothetical protein